MEYAGECGNADDAFEDVKDVFVDDDVGCSVAVAEGTNAQEATSY